MWRKLSTNLTLLAREVHIWRAKLQQSPQQSQQFISVLSADEKQRAEQYYFEQHRQNFIVSRGILRTLLGKYLQREPQQIDFEYSDRGKPKVKGINSLQFNLSHSGEMAIYGFTSDRPIGVDLEYLRPLADAEKIAQRFFSKKEYEQIKALLPEQQQQAFFRAWTAKEAYLKATGAGLTDLEQVEVTISVDQPIRLLKAGKDYCNVTDWRLWAVNPAPQYTATIAVKGNNYQPSYWQIE